MGVLWERGVTKSYQFITFTPLSRSWLDSVLPDRPTAAEATLHPMDALTAPELIAAVSALKAGHFTNEESRYCMLTLHEPTKSTVRAWKSGDPVRREAFAVVKNGPDTFEALVDLSDASVRSWKKVKNAQPGVLIDEWTKAQQIVQADPGWQAALRKRGITDFKDIVCIPLTVGYYGIAEEEGRRLLKVPCFDSRGTRNFWARPVEGVTAMVDLGLGKVVKLIDTGVVPIPSTPVDFDEKSVGPLRAPLQAVSAPTGGRNFRLEGQEVSWQKWHFHFRVDKRVGPVVTLVRYEDKGAARSILYEGSVSEFFVPYMDPDLGWYFRTYMDAGEYGVGTFAASLEPGLDCPANAAFFDATFADDQGVPYTVKRAVCLFERDSGDIAWRHYESVNGQSESRKRTDLVLRLISAIGNYDYIFDWVFRQDGTIQVAVGASGIEQVKAVASRTVADDKDGRDTAYGHMVAEHTVAVNHDHFFCYRLDLDVDGPDNCFVVDHFRTARPGAASPRKSVWKVEMEEPKTERAARRQIDLAHPEMWLAVNCQQTGPVGYRSGYTLHPDANAVSLLSEDDTAQKRGGFTDYHLWVTPYNDAERYAGGLYPNQSQGGDGLPAWTSADRSILNTDIVFWYSLGFHHMVRAEDWPVLATEWHSFELKPFDFFDRNPALDLRKQP